MTRCDKGRFFGAALVLLLAGGGWWWFACPKVTAEVGNERITERDIGYRIGVEQAYGTKIDRPAALVALVNDAMQLQVGQAAGISVSDRELDAFSAFVDRNSKAPQVLVKVKQVFGNNEATYRRDYLAPKVMNRKLHAWFSRDPAMQGKPRADIRRAYALVSSGYDMRRAAEAAGLRFAEQDYRTEKKDAPAALRGYFPGGMAMLSPGFQKLLDALQPGQVANTIDEDDVSYRVVRLVSRTHGEYRTAEIIAAKRPFAPWYTGQAGRIGVSIRDAGLRAAIAGRYPTLPWLVRGKAGGK